MVSTHRSIIFFALCVVAFNLRLALASVGPVLEPMRAELALSHWQGGLLTTLPVLCMGLFAPLAPLLQARFGLKLAILYAAVLLAIATAWRVQGDYILLVLSSIGVGAAIAVLGPLLSAFVKERFAADGARVTGSITMALCLGATAASEFTAPLSETFNWHYALAVWSLCGFGAAVWWHGGVPTVPRTTTQRMALPWRSARAWQLTIIFGLNSAVFYGLLAWLAPAYRDAGLSLTHAGHLLGVFALLQIAGTLVVSHWSPRQRDRRPLLAGFGVATVAGSMLTWLAPLLAPIVAMCLLGVGTAGLFTLTLILPLDYSRTAEETSAWTSMMCGGGYVLAAFAPLLAGWVRDASGGYRDMFALLTALSVVVLLGSGLLRPQRDAMSS